MQIDASRDMALLNNLPAITTLRHVWSDHCTDLPEPLRWRTVKDLPTTADHIVSPYDTEAFWSMKRDVTWAGYKVHLTETCDASQPRLTTHVETTVATTPDDQAVPVIQQALARKALLPRIISWIRAILMRIFCCKVQTSMALIWSAHCQPIPVGKRARKQGLTTPPLVV